MAKKTFEDQQDIYMEFISKLPIMAHAIDKEGLLINVSDFWLQKMGYTREEVVGHSSLEFLTEESKKYAINTALPEFFENQHIENVHYQFVRKDNSIIDVLLSANSIVDKNGSFVCSLATITDITDKILSDKALQDSEDKFKYVFDNSVIGKSVTYFTGEMYANKAFSDMLGYSQDEFRYKWMEITHPDDIELSQQVVDSLLSEERKSVRFTKRYIHKNGSTVWADVSSAVGRNEKGKPLYFITSIIDITDRKQKEKVQKTQLKLAEYALQHTSKELLVKFLDEAENLTKSNIGFYHFYDERNKMLSLQTWSSNTFSKMCKAEIPSAHYPIEKAGVWADCARKKEPVIHNDYESLTGKKGLPEGHAAIVRELVVPVIRGGKIVAVLGVGNKEDDYTEADVKVVEDLADLAWETVSRKLTEEKLSESEGKFRDYFDTNPSATFVWQAKNDDFTLVTVNSAAESLTENKAHGFIGLTASVIYKDMPVMIEKLKACLMHKSTIEFEQHYLNRYKGEYDWIRFRMAYSEPDIILLYADNISKQKEAVTALQESEEKLRGLFTCIKDGIVVVGTDRFIVDSNPAFCDLFGYSLEEIRGKGMRDLYATEEKFLELGHKLQEHSGDKPFVEIIECRKKSGEVFTGEVSVFFMKDANGEVISHIGVVRDITERVTMEEKLMKSQEQFEIAMEASEDGLYDWDLVTNEIYFSPGWKRMLGYEDHELNNDFSVWEEMIKPGDVERAWEMQKELVNNERDRFEMEFQMKHRKGHWVDILSRAKAMFDIDGKAVRIVGTHVDITERKRLEANLLQSRKMESIGNLAGGIAHDFNNILASMLGFSEIALEEAEKGSTMEGNLKEIYAGGMRAKEIVKQILAFARQSDEEVKPIRVDTIIEEALKLIRPSTPTTVEIRKKVESSSLVMGNATQIHQILMNLCTNAAHAMQEDGGIMEVTLKDIFLDKDDVILSQGLKSGKYIELAISDTGRGIAAEHIDSIFDPYFTTKETGEGTGMGLAMVRGIIDSYGGSISVTSDPATKTVFSIYLPITTNLENDIFTITDDPLRGDESILFVDDEPPIALMGSRILEKLGYKVSSRTSSVEALELFKEKPNSFDLVITDMTMPHMTGDKFAMELRRIREDIRIILCTGYSNKISPEIAEEIGINAFTYKPFSIADMAKTIREVLEKS